MDLHLYIAFFPCNQNLCRVTKKSTKKMIEIRHFWPFCAIQAISIAVHLSGTTSNFLFLTVFNQFYNTAILFLLRRNKTYLQSLCGQNIKNQWGNLTLQKTAEMYCIKWNYLQRLTHNRITIPEHKFIIYWFTDWFLHFCQTVSCTVKAWSLVFYIISLIPSTLK